ncbi:MAG TPA: tripartite tricarboxylate transporter TctB family protein [Pseudogracilibacillus sp.]|nr:tripartite tricarboxylate transporter TctB family protein [Pseudogracilibacillus sp.]
MRAKKQDVLLSVILLIITIIFAIQTLDMPSSPAFFPAIILSLLGLFSLFLLMISIVKLFKNRGIKKEKFEQKKNHLAKIFFLFMTFVVYVLLLDLTGYILTTIALFNIVIFLSGYPRKKIYRGILASIVITIIIYIIFKFGLNIKLPTGRFFN